jgi:plasmid stabilization system protein ParE
MKIIITPTAYQDLEEIWRWNAKNYDKLHADEYLAFLNQGIDGLVSFHSRGIRLRKQSDLQYFLLRRKSSGHGHIVVYRCTANEIIVKHLFHTAEDWQSKAEELD